MTAPVGEVSAAKPYELSPEIGFPLLFARSLRMPDHARCI
jgi:hypothetical protein